MSTLSQFITGGGKVRYQDFNASGTFTPSAALLAKGGQCLVEAIGGGASGGSYAGGTSYYPSGGGSGRFKRKLVTVSGAVTVTIGTGGTAVTTNSTGTVAADGVDGANTTFGALLTAEGGKKGLGTAVFSGSGGDGASERGGYATDTTSTISCRGGSGISDLGIGGGGGGVTSYGANHMSAVDGGGNGVTGTGVQTATSGTANTGGGGGAARTTSTSVNAISGAGGTGWLRVTWTE